MPDGYVYLEVDGDQKWKLTFKRSEIPGALVEVTLNNEKINVQPAALLLAARTIAEEG